MKKNKYRESITIKKIPVSTICNRCGLESKELMNFFDVEGGYGSSFPADGDNIKFDLCGCCLKKIISEFKYPVRSSDHNYKYNCIDFETKENREIEKYPEKTPDWSLGLSGKLMQQLNNKRSVWRLTKYFYGDYKSLNFQLICISYDGAKTVAVIRELFGNSNLISIPLNSFIEDYQFNYEIGETRDES